ncbi:ShlB/FhaC/HecB family hemolysin secretion/activation protein [Undibacterium parvum]|uniref:ShlB/FhaC/HecB family hemolysin secretion/activation protein n=2 Tax=Undibacterium TaxID=401469 RepID=A0A6M4A932_9BURK|nr:ShlB/FhaC/HecB family hemolysin secretion/activation protein [Undibacterium parvum]AZP12265.1 ShlB/FhaC/HecB family hemolysin secretion/activation protein [Undibacterium parvum]QJQ06549.1 ShlB/FhaC/HecB family hemolysin secretion/activation protein [Undibacterium piscinae]
MHHLLTCFRLYQKSRSNVTSAVSRPAKLSGLGLILSTLLSNPVFAQSQVDIGAAQRQLDQIQRQEQLRLQHDQDEARRRNDPSEGMDTKALQPKISVPALGAACRQIDSISINGANQLSSWTRNGITSAFTHQCLKIDDFERLLGEITKRYIDRGHISTRAYLAPQDLSKGHLEILVIEGHVEKIIVDDGDAHSVSLQNVLPGVAGNILNLRDLEQGIDQINRLSSNNAQLDIQPGEKAGASVVVIHNQPRSPWHATLSLDNQGSEPTGKQQAAFNASVDNLLGFNELFFLTHRETVPGNQDKKFSGSDSFGLNIPFGYTTFSMSSSYSRYVSTLRVPSGLDLISNGDNRVDNIRLDRILYRDQASRASMAVTLTSKDAKNFLHDQYLGVSSRALTVLDIDSNLFTSFAGGTISLDFGYAMGLDKLNALHDPDYLPDWAARAQFAKFKAGFAYSLPLRLFDKDASFTSQLTSQKAKQTLYGSEQIAIGGLYSVRGFVHNTLAGDDGYYWRNELSLRQPLILGGESMSSRIYLGYDLGEVKNRTANIPQGHMAGMAVGIAVNWRGATWELINTRPLALPATMTRESSQTWFRLAYSM